MLPHAKGCQQPLGAGSDREQVLSWSLQQEAALQTSWFEPVGLILDFCFCGPLRLWQCITVAIGNVTGHTFPPLLQNTFGKLKILDCHTDFKSKHKLEMLCNSWKNPGDILTCSKSARGLGQELVCRESLLEGVVPRELVPRASLTVANNFTGECWWAGAGPQEVAHRTAEKLPGKWVPWASYMLISNCTFTQIQIMKNEVKPSGNYLHIGTLFIVLQLAFLT